MLDPRNYKRVFLCGNGGSAANATHIANDFIAAGIRAHSLTADVATLTAIANDFGYDLVFAKQLRVLADKGDLLVCLSGSGASPNIVAALEEAISLGMKSLLLTGAYHAISAGEMVAEKVILEGDNMQKAEEYQLKWGHQWIKQS